MRSALLVVDIQNDFCPGGALAVAEGDRVVDVANRLIQHFRTQRLPIYFSRDWHPPNHCSFKDFGGPWPAHCVAGSRGAMFHDALAVPADANIISKAATPDREAYSDFDGTGLAEKLRAQDVASVVVLGLATDYCVKYTVLDALATGFATAVVEEGIRAVNAQPGDGDKALAEMRAQGARLVKLAEVLQSA